MKKHTERYHRRALAEIKTLTGQDFGTDFGEWQAHYVKHSDDLAYDRKSGKYTIHGIRRPK